MYFGPFSAQAACRSLAVTATASASITLPGTGSVIRILNEGPNVAYIAIGANTQTATVPSATPNATSCPVPVGDTTFTIPDGNGVKMQLSAICGGTGTATLDIQVGEGF
jgi:hypothetical protein